MGLKYLDPKRLSEKDKAELKRILNFKLREIQEKLEELEQSGGIAKKAKKAKAKKAKR